MAGRFGGRGPGGFARPENALKRSEELEAVGQKSAALQVLHDVITGKRHRGTWTWSKTYEQIMFKHIDLVVDSRKRFYGKEALSQYRNMCQTVNVASLEEVIKYYLKKASDRAEEAQGKATAVTLDVVDLDEDASPEDLMLSYVSGDKSKDRTDRELVTPWYRFLWEAYRSVLEILRSNPKLEPLYAMTANKAFQFCLQFKRTMEFRRLCDLLRQHLTFITMRYRDSRDVQPDQLQVHLETRFEQLKVACELEMWAEAFRSVEDIQGLMAMAKKVPKPALMATYYATLTQIFAVSENHLYHAYAWLKLFSFTKSYNKSLTQADLQPMACSVLLAMLSILPYDQRPGQISGQVVEEQQVEQEKERILRMANILGFAVDARKDYRTLLSRSALLNSVGAVNVLALVTPEIRQVFDLLTSDFSPLELCARLGPLLDNLAAQQHAMPPASPIKQVNLATYIPQLKQVAVLRLLKQLSEVYSSMRVSALEALVPFMAFSELEQVLVDAVKCDYLQVRVDHRAGTLLFGSQQLESEQARGHLQQLAQRLTRAHAMIQEQAQGGASEAALARRAKAMQLAADTLVEANIKANARKGLIEKRKEEAELAMLEAEKEEALRRAAAAREAEVAEEKRRREEALRREKERLERELQEQEMAQAKAMLEAANKNKKPGAKIGKDGDKPLDTRAIMQEALTERIKEAQDQERRMAKQARTLDHLERARREEEAPLLEELGKKKLEEDQAAFAELQAADAEKHRAQWELDLAEKHRLAPVMEDKAVFGAMVVQRRAEEFEALRRQRERKLQERRAQAKAQRALARREEYVRRCQQQVEERVRELEEEEAAREAERKRLEEEERRHKLDELLAQQRKREEEVEAKLRAEKEAILAGAPASAAPAASTTGRFVPPSRRGLAGDAAPPAAAAAASRGAAPYPADTGDRWGRREEAPPPPSRASAGGPFGAAGPAGAAGGGSGDRWQPRGPAAGSSSDAPAGGAGRFVPPSQRAGGSSGGGAAPPPSAAPAPTAAAPPAPSGGKFVPSRLRQQQ